MNILCVTIRCPHCGKLLKQITPKEAEQLIWSIETEKKTTIAQHESNCSKAPTSPK